MWLSDLELVNFRNIRRLRLGPAPGVLLFRGRNGQGKTNLLESVYVLATSRSPRTSTERELLNWSAADDADLAAVINPFARLEGRVRRADGGEVHLQLSFEAERGTAPVEAPTAVGTAAAIGGAVSRSIRINGLPARATGLVGQLPVVYFSPADVMLAGGAPAGRRQYLNLANSQASASHLRALQRYNRVLLQRNQVLRMVRDRRQTSRALEPWTEQMLDWGAIILEQRLGMLHQVDRRAEGIFRDLTGTAETLRIVYRSAALTPDGLPAASVEELKASLRDRQAALAGREVDQAVSLVGPHRDDFGFVLDGVDLTTYGSRGQQRLAVLALKLAEADWMRATVGELPIVLLDDVLSELDPQRRGYVLQRVAEPGDQRPDRQVWVTTTDTDHFSHEFLARAQRFVIDAGQVRPA